MPERERTYPRENARERAPTRERKREPARERENVCEGLPGVYSTIWCLCYKTNKLKKKRNRRRGAGPVYIG